MNRRSSIASALATLLAAAGCGTTPPTEKVKVAEEAVERADTEGAATDAPLELRLARDKLEKANAAMEDERYVAARRLAEQAQVDALLAEAKAESAAARASAREMRESIESLRTEAERAADQQSTPRAPLPEQEMMR